MQNIKEFVYNRLLSDTELQQYVDNRIYPAPAPLGADKPLVVYSRITGYIDAKGIRNEIIQISIWGDKVNELENIMHIIIPLFNNVKTPPIKYAYIKNTTETFDKSTNSYGLHIDVHIKLIEQ